MDFKYLNPNSKYIFHLLKKKTIIIFCHDSIILSVPIGWDSTTYVAAEL